MKATKEKNRKYHKTNNGITLIALVITIIVMLILVAVTITMAVNGGLFEQAGRAGTQTNEKRDAEQEFANVQPDMTYDDLINKYTEGTTDGAQGKTFTLSFRRPVGDEGSVVEYLTFTFSEGMTWAEWMDLNKDESKGFKIGKNGHIGYINDELGGAYGIYESNEDFTLLGSQVSQEQMIQVGGCYKGISGG